MIKGVCLWSFISASQNSYSLNTKKNLYDLVAQANALNSTLTILKDIIAERQCGKFKIAGPYQGHRFHCRTFKADI